MFAYPTQAYYPQPTLDDFFSSSTATTPHSYPTDYLSLLAVRQEQEELKQTRHRQAELVAYLESEHLRRRRQLVLQRALQEEQERRRLEYEVQQALAYRAALIRRAQEEAEGRRQRQLAVSTAVARRRAAVEQARRRAVAVAAEGGKRRRNLEASRQCQALESCPAAFLQQLFGLHDASEVGQHEHVNPPAVATAPSPANKFPPSCLSSAQPISPALEAPADPACFLQLLFGLGDCDEAQPDQVKKPEVAAPTLQQSLPSVTPPLSATPPLSSSATSDFESHQSSFSAPSTLTFQPSHPATPAADGSRPSTPPLTFGKPNASFLEYENFLVQLLSKIDEVQSGGDRTVKKARKELVKEVEAELARLDRMKDKAWEAQSQHEHDEEETAKEVTPEAPVENTPAAKSTDVSENTADLLTPASSLSMDPVDSLPTLPAEVSVPAATTSAAQPASHPSTSSATTSPQQAKQVDDPVFSAKHSTLSETSSPSTTAASPTIDFTPPEIATATALDPPSRPSSRASTRSASSSSDTSTRADNAVEEVLKRAPELGEEVRRLEEEEVRDVEEVVEATPVADEGTRPAVIPGNAVQHPGDAAIGGHSAKKGAEEKEAISEAETDDFEVV
ncbi:hypothetical protein JCM11641_001159 [Rhodosporidiobolus odoratus]